MTSTTFTPVEKTVTQALDEMIDLAASTHWCQGNLCQVIAVDERGQPVVQNYRWDEEKKKRVPVYKEKETYCLVGLAVKVTYEDQILGRSESQITEDTTVWRMINQWASKPRNELIGGIIDALYEQLPEDLRKYEKPDTMVKVQAIETWNDLDEYERYGKVTTREDVIDLMKRARDASAAA